MRRLVKIFWNALAVWGLCSVIGGAYIGYTLVRSYDLTPRQLVVKAARKFGVFPEVVADAVKPRARYAATEPVGRFRSEHPRTLLAGGEVVERLRHRYQTDPLYRERVDQIARGGGLMNQVVAWVCRKDEVAGSRAIQQLERAVFETPRAEGNYGNGLLFALAYDLVGDHPAWTQYKRQRINLLFRKNLEESLLVLDGDSASLWHGRTELAASAWVVAAAMDPMGKEDRALQGRVQRHFWESVEAVRLSGGWPEGYNYWVNNRAFPLALACLAHLHAIESREDNERILNVLTQMGLWTLYGTEPTGRFVLYGDTGPRNDLKDETQRVIDLITTGTELPAFRDYSRYLSGLHGEEAYYGGYRWGLPLFRGNPVWDFRPEEALKDLTVFEGRLPRSAIFGRDGGMGQVFIRSDWGRDATFISFMAGPSMTHHGHYQAGHFTISKGAPLAITSGTYGGYTSPHRLNYSIRTIAANSLLVLRPGEKVQPNRFFEENVADGGQRIVMPTGSAVTSLQDWMGNLHAGRHYEGGRIVAFDNEDERFVYVAGELTDAYNNTGYDDNGRGGKVEWVRRSLVYLRDPDVLIVYDDVKSVRKEYTKKWLLHSWAKPETTHERVLKGAPDNGILESGDASAKIRYKGASLGVRVFLPEDPVLRKVGGPDYRYYVETDGDDSDLDGKNMVEGADEKPWFDAGLWRLEIQPAKAKQRDRFLVLLKPRLEGRQPLDEAEASLLPLDNATGLMVGGAAIYFPDSETPKSAYSYELPQSQVSILHVWTNLPPGRSAKISADNDLIAVKGTTPNGLLTFETPPGGPRQITVRIQ